MSSAETQGFSLKRILLPLLSHPKIAMAVKWSVYSILLYNFTVFIQDNLSAYNNSLAADASLSDILETFSDTIDTLAWLGLVFLLELETNVLSDELLENWVGKLLRVCRFVCCLLVAYAAYGYTAEALDNFEYSEQKDIATLCDVVEKDIALQTDSTKFSKITAKNCEALSASPPYYQIKDKVSLIDGPTLSWIQKIDFIDVVNAFVWLFVIALIETEIRLQWSEQFGHRLRTVQQAKFYLYGVLWLCVLCWLLGGYILYGVDAMVWIAGFWAIELNLTQWEQERSEELRAEAVDNG
ncbi:MAG: hypothetical protein AB8B86_14420 [Pseudomonadales bacterium]